MKSNTKSIIGFAEFTAGHCQDGFYTITGDTLPLTAEYGFDENYSVTVIEEGLKGWPGTHFIRIDLGQGYRLCGFANVK